MNQDRIVYISIIFFIVCLLAFGFSVVGIISNGTKERTISGDCSMTPANVTYFELTKSVFSLWNWKYDTSINGHSVLVRQACYSINHDVLMYTNGGLSASSDGKVLSTTSDVYINDCHGDRLYKITTGSFWITLLNTNRIAVSFVIEDRRGNVVGYIDGVDYFLYLTKYSIKDINGVEIVLAHKDITSFPWKWKITIRDPTSPLGDIRALAIIFAHTSFSEGGTDSKGNHVDTTDICNAYVLWTGITVCIVLGLLLVFICYWFWIQLKECCSRLKYGLFTNDSSVRRVEDVETGVVTYLNN